MNRYENFMRLGSFLKNAGYQFVTTTPESHRRVYTKRKEKDHYDLRDVFGWNLPFSKGQIDPQIYAILEEGSLLEEYEGQMRSLVRFSSVGEDLYMHSSYPTVDKDSVFFGPDTYRFVSLIRRELEKRIFARKMRIMDVGCGTGVGAITASRCLKQPPDLIFSDINVKALEFARVNAALAGIENAHFIESDILKNTPGEVDLIVSNPPYLIDPEARLYRNGGGELGCDLSLRIVQESLKHLSSEGLLLLYTGTPIVEGESVFLKKLQDNLSFEGFNFRYEEIDPDIFGEELERSSYGGVERIAAVALIVSRMPEVPHITPERFFSSPVQPEIVHHRLALFNRSRLQPSTSLEEDWQKKIHKEEDMRFQELTMVEEARKRIQRHLLNVPAESFQNPGSFMKWFESLKATGPGQNDSLFPWLENEASLDDMRWFLTQEMSGEAGFDDLVALTQVKMPFRSKLEMAKNYWDEMGRGNYEGLHSLLLKKVGTDLNLQSYIENTVWESLALANLMTALAVNRRYAYLSVGALGAVEMTAPTRVAHVNAGLKRLKIAASTRQYFAVHASLDVRHSEEWNREVILPLIQEKMEIAPLIAEGALLRLSFGARCFERYRREFGVSKYWQKKKIEENLASDFHQRRYPIPLNF